MVNVKGEQMKLNIWDTAGHQDYKMITASFLKGCAGIVIVYDTLSGDWTPSVEDWMDIIRKYSDGQPPIFLVGNKFDILPEESRPALEAQVEELVLKHKLSHRFFVAVA